MSHKIQFFCRKINELIQRKKEIFHLIIHRRFFSNLLITFRRYYYAKSMFLTYEKFVIFVRFLFHCEVFRNSIYGKLRELTVGENRQVPVDFEFLRVGIH